MGVQVPTTARSRTAAEPLSDATRLVTSAGKKNMQAFESLALISPRQAGMGRGLTMGMGRQVCAPWRVWAQGFRVWGLREEGRPQ